MLEGNELGNALAKSFGCFLLVVVLAVAFFASTVTWLIMR